MTKNITIIGGGNSTHSLIPLLSGRGNNINLLTRKPEKWSKNVSMEFTLPDGSIKDVLQGELSVITNKAEDIIPESDIIILSLPVCQYRNILKQIAPFINKDKKVFLGTIYGQGGFNWMVESIKKEYHLDNLVYFASGLIPWITRTKEYGKVGINYGCKKNNVVAVNPANQFDTLKDILLDDLCYTYFGQGEYIQADNFISLTLSVDNQIIHQTRLYGMFLKYGGEWDSYDEVPFFYRDYDDISAQVLEDLDSEYTLIRNAIVNKYPDESFQYMLNYLDLEHFSYGSSSENIKSSFTESETLGQIPTPVVEVDGKWIFDATHRFFYDDIYYGIAIAKWIAEKLNIETPTIDKIICWSQQLLDDKLLDSEGKLIKRRESNDFLYGTPDVYGYDSIKEIMG